MQEPESNVVAFPVRRRGAGAASWTHRGDRLRRRAERRATVLFAELRGWRVITGAIGRPEAEAGLARLVDRALETLLDFGAFDVTLDGQPLQPTVSATFDGPGHALGALHAADALRREVAAAQSPTPPRLQFQVCTGLHTGDIVHVELGEEDPVSFRSIGTLRSFAARLQEFAGPGQVFLSAATYEELPHHVSARSIGDVRMNGHGEKQEAFALTGFEPAT